MEIDVNVDFSSPKSRHRRFKEAGAGGCERRIPDKKPPDKRPLGYYNYYYLFDSSGKKLLTIETLNIFITVYYLAY